MRLHRAPALRRRRAEHEAATKGVGVIDRSLIGKVTVTGRDRQAFLQGMLSNEVKSLQPGQGTGAAFLDAHGKVMVLLQVYVLEDRLLLELPPGLTTLTLERLDKFLISEKAYFEASDDSFAVLALEGPRAEGLLSSLCGRSARPRAVPSRGSLRGRGARSRDQTERRGRRRLSMLDDAVSRRAAVGGARSGGRAAGRGRGPERLEGRGGRSPVRSRRR